MKKIYLFALVAMLLHVPLVNAAPLELSFESCYPHAQLQNVEVLVPWSESFAQKTNNQLIMNFFSLTPVEMPEIGHAIHSGMLDLGLWSPFFPKETPYMSASTLPYLATNPRQMAEMYQAFYNEIPEYKKEVDSIGVPITFVGGMPTALISLKPIKSPADLKGKRVLIPTASFADVIEAWGGIPVLIPSTDIYIGLQRGMGEAYISGISNVKGLRLFEIAKNVTILGYMTTSPMNISINHDLFKELTPEQQALMISSGKETQELLIQSFYKDYEISMNIFKDNGCTIYELDQAQLQEFEDLAMNALPKYIEKAKSYGVKDAEAYINRLYEIAGKIQGTPF